MQRRNTPPLADLWRDSLARLERQDPHGDVAATARSLAIAALIARVESDRDEPESVVPGPAGRRLLCARA